MMAYRYAAIKKDLHGIAVKGRLAYAMRAGSVGTRIYRAAKAGHAACANELKRTDTCE